MVEGFEKLNPTEQDQIIEAIPLITLLIANADGQIDHFETDWAKKLTEIRTYTFPRSLHEYYEQAGQDFDEHFNSILKTLPPDAEGQRQVVIDRLAELNGLMKKVEPDVAVALYKSLKSFAKHVAKSSGGFLGMMSIGPEEKKLMELPMIDSIVW